jgi:polysaccharide export outer membrane protein
MAAEPEAPAKETQPASAIGKPDASATEKKDTGTNNKEPAVKDDQGKADSSEKEAVGAAGKQDAVGDVKQSENADSTKAVSAPDKQPAAVEKKADTGAVVKEPAVKDDKGNDKDSVGKKVTDGNYIIGPGDILYISVWRDDVLTKDVVVLPDGKISFPLIGEVDAGGRKLKELKQEMESRLSSYVQDVVLSIDVKQVNSMVVYVIGRVNNPGRQILNTNVTVLQSLAAAGGLNPFARRSKIKIIRQTENMTQVFKFDYDDVADGSNLEQNIILKRGDVIVVP